jgi:hypothetical protein
MQMSMGPISRPDASEATRAAVLASVATSMESIRNAAMSSPDRSLGEPPDFFSFDRLSLRAKDIPRACHAILAKGSSSWQSSSMAVRRQKKKNGIEQGSWTPGGDADELMDIMSRVSGALMAHRDLDMDPKPLALLASKISEAMLGAYESMAEESDMDDDGEEALWDLFLSTISGTVQYTSAEELVTKAGISELVKVCVRHTGPLWEAYAAISGGDEEEDEEDDEDDALAEDHGEEQGDPQLDLLHQHDLGGSQEVGGHRVHPGVPVGCHLGSREELDQVDQSPVDTEGPGVPLLRFFVEASHLDPGWIQD